MKLRLLEDNRPFGDPRDGEGLPWDHGNADAALPRCMMPGRCGVWNRQRRRLPQEYLPPADRLHQTSRNLVCKANGQAKQKTPTYIYLQSLRTQTITVNITITKAEFVGFLVYAPSFRRTK